MAIPRPVPQTALIVARLDIAHLSAQNQGVGLVLQQSHYPFGDLLLFLEIEQMKEGTRVDNVDLTRQLLDEIGTIVKDIDSDEMGIEFITVEEEIISK